MRHAARKLARHSTLSCCHAKRENCRITCQIQRKLESRIYRPSSVDSKPSIVIKVSADSPPAVISLRYASHARQAGRDSGCEHDHKQRKLPGSNGWVLSSDSTEPKDIRETQSLLPRSCTPATCKRGRYAALLPSHFCSSGLLTTFFTSFRRSSTAAASHGHYNQDSIHASSALAHALMHEMPTPQSSAKLQHLAAKALVNLGTFVACSAARLVSFSEKRFSQTAAPSKPWQACRLLKQLCRIVLPKASDHSHSGMEKRVMVKAV